MFVPCLSVILASVGGPEGLAAGLHLDYFEQGGFFNSFTYNFAIVVGAVFTSLVSWGLKIRNAANVT